MDWQRHPAHQRLKELLFESHTFDYQGEHLNECLSAMYEYFEDRLNNLAQVVELLRAVNGKAVSVDAESIVRKRLGWWIEQGGYGRSTRYYVKKKSANDFGVIATDDEVRAYRLCLELAKEKAPHS
jgi:hypothetical protein